MFISWLAGGFHSATILTQSSPCLEGEVPTMDWALLHQVIIKTLPPFICPHRPIGSRQIPHSPSREAVSNGQLKPTGQQLPVTITQ